MWWRDAATFGEAGRRHQDEKDRQRKEKKKKTTPGCRCLLLRKKSVSDVRICEIYNQSWSFIRQEAAGEAEQLLSAWQSPGETSESLQLLSSSPDGWDRKRRRGKKRTRETLTKHGETWRGRGRLLPSMGLSGGDVKLINTKRWFILMNFLCVEVWELLVLGGLTRHHRISLTLTVKVKCVFMISYLLNYLTAP